MPFQKGREKTGGRQKGSMNQRSQELFDLAKDLGIDPFKIMLQFAAGDWRGLGYERQTKTVVTKDGGVIEEDVISPELRGSMAKEAIKYLAPQLKSVEITGDDLGAKYFVAVDARTLIQTIGKDPMIGDSSSTGKLEQFIQDDQKEANKTEEV